MKNNYEYRNFFESEIIELETQLHEITFAKKVDKFGKFEEKFNLKELEKNIKESIRYYKEQNKILNATIKKMLKNNQKFKKEELIVENAVLSYKLNKNQAILQKFQNIDKLLIQPLLLWFVSISENWTDNYMTTFCDIVGLKKFEIDEIVNTYKNAFSEKIKTISNKLAKAETLDDPEYKVGYGKPPKHTQFKKGKNNGGNKKGRKPIKGQCISDLAIEKLDKKINIKTKDGKTTKKYYRDVIADNIVNTLATGKPFPRNNMKVIDKLERIENFWKTWKKK